MTTNTNTNNTTATAANNNNMVIHENIPRIFSHSSVDPDSMAGFNNWALVTRVNEFLHNEGFRWEGDGHGGITLTECLLEDDQDRHITVPYTIPGTGLLVTRVESGVFRGKCFRSVVIPIGCMVKPHSFNGFSGAVVLDKSSCYLADDGYNYSLEQEPGNNYVAIDYNGNIIKDRRRKQK